MKIMVLDTEGYSNVNAYNLGYTIVDLTDNTIVERVSVAVLPYLWDNLNEKLRRSSDNVVNAKLSEMQLKNTADILTDSGKKYSKLVRSENGLFKHFSALFKKYSDISAVFAFNVAFDKSALKRSLTEKHFEKLFGNTEFKDVQTAVFYAFCYNLEYIQWAIVNGYTTEQGNIKTTAEVFYRYIMGKTDFVEEHTALADAEIETEMLIKALEKNADIPTKPCRCYLKLNELYDKDNPKTIENFMTDYLFAE